jgi:putative DNA primase/helicase
MRKRIRVKLVAVAEDEAKGEFLAIIEFRDIDGKYRQLIVPRSDLDDLKSLRKTLTNVGCYFPKDEDRTKSALALLAQSAQHAERWQLAAQTGWYHGHRQFVRPNGVIGIAAGEKLIKPPRRHPGEHIWPINAHGSHKKWVEHVAKPAQQSSRMVLAISAALAAPLLDFVDLNSFGILIHGPGKAGKSTLLVLAGSVIGFAYERDLPNFRSTDAAFGEIPSSFNDMLLPVNELGLLKGNPKERSERIRDLSFGIAEGRGTTYSKLAPINKSNANNEWRAIVLASGEEASEDISEAAGHTRAVGAAIRWIDLCATRNGGKDIFDFCPKEVSNKNRAAWVQQQCAALRQSCRRYHGVAFDHFVGNVIEHRKALKLDLHELMNQFMKKVDVGTNDNPAIGHLAMCFALIAAAGCLGVRFGTLPWTERFVMKCVRRCYRDARRQLRTEDDLLRQGLRILEDGIGSKLLKLRRKNHYSKDAWKLADGYREKARHGIKATIRGEAFRGWFKDQRQPATVLRWLHSKNALASKRKPFGGATSITWSEVQPTWPDGSRPRSIVIELSHGLLDQLKV